MTPSFPLEVTAHIAASPDIVFPYFTDPDRYVQWMGTEATLDATPGGTYRVYLRPGVEALGEFVEVDPPRRLVFTWGWVDHPVVGPGSTRVEVLLEPDGDGTLVRLLHHDLPGPEAASEHREGWQLYLARLTTVTAGEDPGPDPNAG